MIRFLTMMPLLIVMLGCGSGKPTPLPIQGVVTLDGKPIGKAAVMLVPTQANSGAAPALGVTDSLGQFILKTEKIGDGALQGSYTATVIKKETLHAAAVPDKFKDIVAPSGINERWIIPKKYSMPNDSGLAVEVKPGMEPLRFDLKSR